MSQAKTSNHFKAPVSAAFVGFMRQVFGADVKTTHVNESDVVLGQKGPEGASCFFCGTGQRISDVHGQEKKKRAA
jgi:hypothetical protein